MPQRFTLDEIRARTYKDRDAWWTVWLVDPVAARLVWLLAPYRACTPNRITAAAFLLGLGSAGAFAGRTTWWLVAGAVLFHLSFVLDCVDGKIARLNGTGSIFGVWLDFVLDRVKVLICAVALFGGEFARTGDLAYLWTGGAVIFLDLFRYVNSSQLAKVRAALAGEPAAEAARDVYGEVGARFGRFTRLRDALLRRRVRAHLVSGIEFEMFVFIVGPLTGLVVALPLVAGALLLAFELLLVYKTLAATRTYQRLLDRASQDAMQQGHVGDRLEPGLGVQL